MHNPDFRLSKSQVLDWGRIDYSEALMKQEMIFNQCLQNKLEGKTTQDYFIFCEHNPVFTLGRGGDKAHLLLDDEELKIKQIAFYQSSRGGDITFHGPGQIVCYPILDLTAYKTDVRWYVKSLEEAVIRTLADFGIQATRLVGYPGVWLDIEEEQRTRKICAIGVRLSRWQTMHGLALNVNTDLNGFTHIIPCGIQHKKVSSMALELGTKCPNIIEVKARLLKYLLEVFREF